MPETTTFTPSNILAYALETPPNSVPITVKSGQNLPAGQVVARETDTGKYVAYNDAGSNGVNVASGILPYAVNASSTGQNRDVDAPMWTGNAPLIESVLTGLDANAKTDLGGRSLPGRDVFLL